MTILTKIVQNQKLFHEKSVCEVYEFYVYFEFEILSQK